MHCHSTAAFLSQFLVPVLRSHLLLREVAGLELEVYAVQGHYFSEQLGLNLLGELLESIAVEEVPAFTGMSMEIQEEAESKSTKSLPFVGL